MVKPRAVVDGALTWSAASDVLDLRALDVSTPLDRLSREVAAAAPDAVLVAPGSWPARAPRDPRRVRPLPEAEDMVALEDDAAWDALVARDLKRPWFALAAGLEWLLPRGRGAVVVVVPRRTPPALEGADEATVRATLRGFVRASAERCAGTRVRVNLLELPRPDLDARAVAALAWLCGPDAAVRGQSVVLED